MRVFFPVSILKKKCILSTCLKNSHLLHIGRCILLCIFYIAVQVGIRHFSQYFLAFGLVFFLFLVKTKKKLVLQFSATNDIECNCSHRTFQLFSTLGKHSYSYREFHLVFKIFSIYEWYSSVNMQNKIKKGEGGITKNSEFSLVLLSTRVSSNFSWHFGTRYMKTEFHKKTFSGVADCKS